MFRQYYRRPYFLPPMAEAVEENWFIVSSGESKTLNVSISGHYFDMVREATEKNFFQSLPHSHNLFYACYAGSVLKKPYTFVESPYCWFK